MKAINFNEMQTKEESKKLYNRLERMKAIMAVRPLLQCGTWSVEQFQNFCESLMESVI